MLNPQQKRQLVIQLGWDVKEAKVGELPFGRLCEQMIELGPVMLGKGDDHTETKYSVYWVLTNTVLGTGDTLLEAALDAILTRNKGPIP